MKDYNKNMNSINEPLCTVKRFFTSVEVCKNIVLQDKLPDFIRLISSIEDTEVISIKTVSTSSGCSNEGKYLGGKKVVIQLLIRQKILYISKDQKESIHVFENSFIKSIDIVVPEKLEGTNIRDLIDRKLLKPNITIEHTTLTPLNKRVLNCAIFLFVELIQSPTYQICFSSYENNIGNLYLAYTDGSRCTRKTFFENSKIIKPIWAPNKNRIAFLLKKENKNLLYILNTVDNSVIQITDYDIFTNINSFSWISNGNNIIFSANNKEDKELYMVDVNTKKITQLTHGNCMVKSYKPVNSPKGSYIAYLKSISGVVNLWLMDCHGGNNKKITSKGNIKGFSWSSDEKFIAYTYEDHIGGYEIIILDIITLEEKKICLGKEIPIIRNIQLANNKYLIAFIGRMGSTENIYIYDLRNDSIHNITHSLDNITIESFSWNIDCNKIYYSANEFRNSNIYCIELDTYFKYEIINRLASNVNLSYRCKIV